MLLSNFLQDFGSFSLSSKASSSELSMALVMDFHESTAKKRRKYRQDKDDEQSAAINGGIDCLPQEVALDIISSLPISSLIQFRFVCKTWGNLSYDPNLVSLHLSKALKGNPYLIFHCDFPMKNLLYFVEFSHTDGDQKDKVRKFEMPFSNRMPEFIVIGSSNGLLCLVNSLLADDALYIYNPFTGYYKELPRPKAVYQDPQIMYGFGFHPSTNHYKVIKIVYYADNFNLNMALPARRTSRLHRYLRSDVQILSLGANRWRSIGPMPYQLDRSCSSVLLNGRFHWTTKLGNYNGYYGRKIVSFDLSDELFREVPGPDFLDARMVRRSYHLAILGGCLCAAVPVMGSGGSLDIWVMKEYNRKESWVKELSIGVFCPNLISQDLQRKSGIWRSLLNRRMVTVLCLLKNGEILLEYKGGTLVSYNPEQGSFSNITFPRMPKLFQTYVHVGSLTWF